MVSSTTVHNTLTTLADWKTDAKSWWCPGCGDFGVLAALHKALISVGGAPENVVVVAGVGCSGKIGNYVNSYNLHVTHGRTLPAAMGVKMANPSLTVIAAGGDGDGFAIGMSHFIHACRRNIDVTYIVMDNRIYGLTKGQTSPTSQFGFESKSTPDGSPEGEVAPAMLALVSGASYVAQGFSANQKSLLPLIAGGIAHRGFSFINVLSPCVTYNQTNTFEFFKANLFDLSQESSYQPNNRLAAMQVLMDHDQLVEGVLFQSERPPFESLLPGFRGEDVVRRKWPIDPNLWSELLQHYQ